MANASGCQGQAFSTTDDGLKLDQAAAPGVGGTLADPFDVSWSGAIAWNGTTTKAIKNGSWSVTMEPVGGGLTAKAFSLAVSTLAKGDVGNETGKTTASGSARLSDYLSVRAVTGTYRVSWDVSGDAATCTGSAVIAITGNPMTTPAFFLAMVLILLGGAALLPLLMLLLGWTGGAS
jgi:hypothetical protein